MTDLFFVHGINHSPSERAVLGLKVRELVRSTKLDDVFRNVHVGAWRSLGSWAFDLEDLLVRPQRREEAVNDVCNSLVRSAWGLKSGRLVAVGHSMGQPLLVNALRRATAENLLPPKVSIRLVTVGGPIGNTNPVSTGYMKWAHRGELGIPWTDVWNAEDPICCDLILHSISNGYRPPEGSRPFRVVAPGTPTPWDPTKEHSAYFELPAFVDLMRNEATA